MLCFFDKKIIFRREKHFLAMRILLYSFFVTVVVSCTGSVEQSSEQTQRSTVEAYEPTYQGVWVNKKYVEALEQTHSPKVAQNSCYISYISIPREQSAEILIVHNFHEGITYRPVSLGKMYVLNTSETSDTLKFEDGDKIAFWKGEKFVKLQQHHGEGRIVEELLIAGKYTLEGNNKEVVFTYEGKIQGLESYRYYKINVDYMDAGMQLDQIELSKDGKKWDRLGFSVEGNRARLHLFELKCEEFDPTTNTCQEVSRGREVFLLKRKESTS